MEQIRRLLALFMVLSMIAGLGLNNPRPAFALENSIYDTCIPYIESNYTEDERQAFKTEIERLSAYKGSNESLEGTLYTSDITLDQIVYYLMIYKGEKTKNKQNKILNPYIYKKYKLVAYDDLSIVEHDQYGHGSYERVDTINGKELEYRYLGYSYTGTEITNDFYPADFTSGTDALVRNYKTSDEAPSSWKEFKYEPHYGQLFQLMNTDLLNDDETDGVYEQRYYTAFDLLKLSSFPDYYSYLSNSSVRTAQSKMIMMQYPSLGAYGQFKLTHGTNRTFYDTFRTKEMTLKASVEISPMQSVYFIAPDQETVTIDYQVKSTINDAETSLPYSNGLNLQSVDLISEGKKINVFSNPFKKNKDIDSTVTSTFSKTINVKNLDLTDGTDEVTLTASSEYTDIVDYVVAFNAQAVTVKVCAASDFVADFTIHDPVGDDVTEGTITVPDLYFNTPIAVNLKDASATEKGNIISRTWYVLDGTEYKPISSLNETDVSYTVNAANRASVLHGNKLSFKLVAKTDLSQDTEVAIHEVTFGKEISAPSGPVAIISAKLNDEYIAMEGQVFDINGRESYHPEGVKLVDFAFKTNGGYVSSTGSKKNDYIYYTVSGRYYPELTVTDANGGKDTDSTTIRVRPAEFVPLITVDGTLKENRKLSVSVKNEYSLRYFPIDLASLNWKITPLDGQGDVVRVDGAADGSDQFDVLFKAKGRYRIDVVGNIRNGARYYSGSASTTITIAEDIAPVADFTVAKEHIRNVSNNNMTAIIIYDKSHSVDNDYITQRKYWYRYDDDNDGTFTDTDWILLSAANYTQMTLLADQVGEYQFKVEVKEGFGQPTISTFITDSDYKRGNTDAKTDADKMTEMINIAPTVNLDIANKKPVHLIVYHDYDAPALTNFKNQVEILKAKLLGKQMELSVDYLTPTEVVGTKDNIPVYFDTYINVAVGVKGWDEDGDSYNKTRNVKLLLHTENLSESGSYVSQAGRYKVNSVKLDDSVYNGGTFDDDRVHVSFSGYRNLYLNYTDTWTNKTYSKVYKFVIDYWYYTHYSNSETKQESKEENLNGASVVADEASYIGTGSLFNDWDAGFYIGRSYDAYLSMTRDYTVKQENLYAFSESSLVDIMNGIPEGADTYFLNMASKEVNRLALNETLLSSLKSKNAHYLTLNSQSIPVNPLSGIYAESFVGDENDAYVAVGDRAYLIDTDLGSLIPAGSTKTIRDKCKNTSISYTNNPSVYSSSYTSGYSTYTGEDALAKWGEDQYKGVYSYWEDFDEGGGQSTGVFSWTYLKSINFYGYYMNHEMNVEDDGRLTYYPHYYNYRNYSMEYAPASAGTGYLGRLYKDGYLIYYPVYRNDGYGGSYAMYGYLNENGNIYFKYTLADFPSTIVTTAVVTEGIDNIRNIFVNQEDYKLYVYTDNQVILYNVLTGARTVLVDNALEIRGASAKIGENKWQIGETVYDGYKEIYSSEIEGTSISLRYVYRDRSYTTTAYNKTLIYIDENDDLYLDQDFSCSYIGNTNAFHTATKLASDVESLPVMATSAAKVPMPLDVFGNLDKSANYQLSVLYVEKSTGLLKPMDWRVSSDFTKSSVTYVAAAGQIIPINPTTPMSRILVAFEDGRSGFITANGTYFQLVPFKYAELTIGSPGDVVGDNQLIGVSPLSVVYENLDELLEGIYAAYSNYSGTNDVYVLLGDNIEVTMLYDDYESDEAYSMVYDFEHTNPNYFENSLGKDPNAGTGLLKPLTTLNYVGHYEVRPKAKDNPKDDDRFAEYRLENMDEALVNVYVHRRPIALMNFRFGVSSVEPNYLTLTCTDNGSYDLDHESAIGKGIVKYEFAIKGENDASWIKVNQSSFTHLKIERGVEYKIIYRVQDIEGAWSLPLEKTFKLDEVPVNLTAKIQARDDGFSIDGMPITEYFNIYDIETEYPKELKLEIALYDGDIRKGSLITVPFNEGASAVRDGTNPNLVKWNPRDLQVPLTLPDKAYQLKVTAIDVSNPLKTAEVVFDVGVRTPINLYPEIMPEELLAEEAYMLKAFTSKYAGTLIVKAFKDTAKEKSITMPLDGSVVANMKKWLKEEVVPAVDEGEYTFEFTATTPNGNSETAILVKKIQSVKLFDFNVFDSSDYDQASIFDSGAKFYAKDLAVDKFDGPLMKMGYAFYFDISSKGLKDATDTIRITPSFEDWYGRKLDMYYDDEKNGYILGVSPSGSDSRDTFELYYSGKMKASEKLGTFSELNLPTGLRTVNEAESTEKWRGRYGLPLSTIFTLPGQDPRISDNRIETPVTIVFKIEAIKDGGVVYDYILSGQWEKERLNEYGNPINSTKYTNHGLGEVIVVDPSRTGKEDFSVRPVW